MNAFCQREFYAGSNDRQKSSECAPSVNPIIVSLDPMWAVRCMQSHEDGAILLQSSVQSTEQERMSRIGCRISRLFVHCNEGRRLSEGEVRVSESL